jgi:hypothetical protein
MEKSNSIQKYNNKVIIITVSIIGTLILIIAAAILYTDLTRPKPNYEGFRQAVTSYINNNKDILEVKILDDNLFKVTVSDKWYTSPEVAKLRFCQSIHDALYLYARQSKLIYRDMDDIFVTVYDRTGIHIAEQELTDYKLLH